MKRYFKFRWNETRGDEFDEWGFSTFYSETDGDLFTTRQIQIYDNGIVLKYDSNNLSDEFGGLADQSIEGGLEESNEISQEEFEAAWTSVKAFNKNE